jgi:hypothetical protein
MLRPITPPILFAPPKNKQGLGIEALYLALPFGALCPLGVVVSLALDGGPD